MHCNNIESHKFEFQTHNFLRQLRTYVCAFIRRYSLRHIFFIGLRSAIDNVCANGRYTIGKLTDNLFNRIDLRTVSLQPIHRTLNEFPNPHQHRYLNRWRHLVVERFYISPNRFDIKNVTSNFIIFNDLINTGTRFISHFKSK